MRTGGRGWQSDTNPDTRAPLMDRPALGPILGPTGGPARRARGGLRSGRRIVRGGQLTSPAAGLPIARQPRKMFGIYSPSTPIAYAVSPCTASSPTLSVASSIRSGVMNEITLRMMKVMMTLKTMMNAAP